MGNAITQHKRLILGFFVLFLGFICSSFTASAASFRITPSSANISSGSIFSVTISINTEGSAINAAESAFSFSPTQYLSVENISTAGSIFKFWVEEPTFSNAAGTISFSGGSPSPGYTGTNGTVATVTFRAAGAGESQLAISRGAILANDGLGTNVFSGSGSGLYTITAATIAPPSSGDQPSTEKVVGVPALPVFISKTHPLENRWYHENTFDISWALPTGVDAVNYAFVQNAQYSLPRSSRGVPTGTSYDLSDLSDGVWYFYARFRNSNGWGPVAKFIVRVDRTPPAPFDILVQERVRPTYPTPTVEFATTDATSKVSHYIVRIDKDEEWIDSNMLAYGEGYRLPPLLPGTHTIIVRAYDSADNYMDSTASVTIEALLSPIVTQFIAQASPPQKPIVIEGKTSYTEESGRIMVILTRMGEFYEDTFETPVSSDGTWKAEYRKRLTPGRYTLTAVLINSFGARSFPVEVGGVTIGNWLSDWLLTLGEFGIAIIVGAIALGLLIAAILFMHTRLVMLKRRFVGELRIFEKKLESDARRLEKDLESGTKGAVVDLSEAARRSKQKRIEKDVEKIKSDIEGELAELKESKKKNK